MYLPECHTRLISNSGALQERLYDENTIPALTTASQSNNRCSKICYYSHYYEVK